MTTLSIDQIKSGTVATVRGRRSMSSDCGIYEAGVGATRVEKEQGVYVILRPAGSFEQGILVDLTLENAIQLRDYLSAVIEVQTKEQERQDRIAETRDLRNRIKDALKGAEHVANEDDPDWSVLYDTAHQLNQIADIGRKRNVSLK